MPQTKEYYKLKMRESRQRNPTYYVIVINGIEYAFTSERIRQNKIKKSNLSENCVVCV